MTVVKACRLSQSERRLSSWFSHRLSAFTLTIAMAVLQSLWLTSDVAAQATIQSVQPSSIRPGETVSLQLNGKDLKEPLRVLASRSDVTTKVEKVEATQAIITLTVPADASPGPLGLYVATEAGPQPTQILLVDDLPSVRDNGSNHSRDTAQAIESLQAVDGVCDGPTSDFFRITVAAGQRLAFSVITQSLDSKMDPVLRLTDAAGRSLALVDDDERGPECTFSHRFAEAGDYWIELRDSRYAAGHAYHLRVGDFPIVVHASPLAIQRGQQASIQFIEQDGLPLAPLDITAPNDLNARSVTAAAKIAEGEPKSSAWVTLAISDVAQVVAPEKPAADAAPFTLPIGLTGQLSTARERDAVVFQGTQGQAVRFSSRTRSLGSPALLTMELFNHTSNAKVAETKVGDSDEWGFDYTFPDNALYRLEVTDLLHRGGNALGYYIEARPAGWFTVELKPAAETKQAFLIEPQHGAAALDLVIDRFGYDGEIVLSLPNLTSGLRIVPNKIAAGAKEARVYLFADDQWQATTQAPVQLMAQSVGDAKYQTTLRSLAVQRVKQPHLLFPADWNNGIIEAVGVSTTEAFFSLEPAQAATFARPCTDHALTLKLNRKQAEFKAAITLQADTLPAGWSLTPTNENDQYTIKCKADPTAERAESLRLVALGEYQNRLRREQLSVPIQWIDPLKIVARADSPWIVGGSASITVRIERSGDDPQPVTLKAINLPAGLIAPTDPITIAADQTQSSITLTSAADFKPAGDLQISFEATSKNHGSDYKITSQSEPIAIEPAPVRLETFPLAIALNDARSRQQLIITGFDADQAPRDWTHRAQFTSHNPAVAEVRDGVVYPKGDGETEIEVAVGAVKVNVPVKVSGYAVSKPIAFESEVLVALSKQSCNSGACHGSPSGKGSFRLSLRAFDPKLDEMTLLREDFARRVNPLDPERSLLLTKPLMKVAHGGGKQLHKPDVAYDVLKTWIAEGAKADAPGTPRCVRLEITPHQKRVLQRDGGGQQLAATAHFADGAQRDVTHLVAYESSNTEVAKVDHQGRVTPLARGETVILVRFLEHIESLPLMFIDPNPDFQWAAPAPNNYVDELVNAKLKQLQYLPAETCTDAEFLRRVYLDVIGLLPTNAESSRFLASSSTNKRSELIDELLQRDEYAKYWALKWGDLLRLTNKLVGDEGVHKYHRWLEESFRNNMPYDQFARELLTSSGSTLANPPANFYRTATDMNECVETVSQLFLGARLQCAKCHNHPFERWTQDNYYGLGAFFQRVQRKKTQRPGEMIIWNAGSGEVTQPRTGQTMKPWVPRQGVLDTVNDIDRREAFATWLANPNNPYFAKMEVNRLWSQLFARGIVDPIDDFRDSNPPANEPLLDALAKDFAEHGFDRKRILKTILNSRTYQASCKTTPLNQDDDLYFSHQLPRFLSAEQLLDAINQAMGLTQTFAGLPADTKATQLPSPDMVKVDFLRVFGQPERNTVCACERTDESNLGMAIELFNGTLVHEKLRDANNRFRKAIAEKKPEDEIIRDIYLATLCREPSAEELTTAATHCKSAGDLAAGLEDICWALLNTEEFLFQH